VLYSFCFLLVGSWGVVAGAPAPPLPWPWSVNVFWCWWVVLFLFLFLTPPPRLKRQQKMNHSLAMCLRQRLA
ncbi:hypothetical protein ACQWHS_24655, partial [Salmonella enterica subsp. enterica serovar Infantis]